MHNEEENGKIVEFPEDEVRMPPPRLPQPIGEIPPGHPFRKIITVLLIVLGIFVVVYIAIAIMSEPPPQPDENNPTSFSEMYREEGAITYQDEILHGWFLEPERQHFMSEDGRRFTYVDSHSREGEPVMGYWRLIE
jgi:hypothetical protein